MTAQADQLAVVAALAEKQAGAVAAWQAEEAGLSRKQFDRLLESKPFRRLARGIYRLAGAPETFEQKVWAACLQARGVASHRTAAWLWDLDGVAQSAPSKIDLMVPFGKKHLARGARVHRSRTYSNEQRCLVRGVPSTSLARTLVDLSHVLTPRALELALASGLRKEPKLYEQLETMLGSMPTSAVDQLKRLRPLLSARDREVDSALEVRVRSFLRREKIPTPLTQLDIFDGNAFLGRFDFAWPENDPPVVLQAHGERYHGNSDQWRRDLQQASELNEIGWRLLQCTMSDVMKRPARLAQMLRRALAGYRGDGKYSDEHLRDVEARPFPGARPRR